MKITREEFKELVELYNKIDKSVNNALYYVQDEIVDGLAYPVLDWVIKRLDIDSEYGDLLHDLNHYGELPIDWDYDDDGIWCNVVYSSDLDEIYDKYLGEHSYEIDGISE